MKKYSKETAVGVFVVIGLAAIGYLTIHLGDLGVLGAGTTYPLEARFTNVSGLRPGAAVTMYGLPVGKVGQMRIDPARQQAVVELRIDRGVEIFDDAIASIKTEGLIGDKFVSIDPGGAGAMLAPGQLIIDTESPVDVMDLISRYAFGDVQR
jgi:phospholipid/cholesterol/gamma-HCH transport system substrate-binding protein